jgi:hypothetical protein
MEFVFQRFIEFILLIWAVSRLNLLSSQWFTLFRFLGLQPIVRIEAGGADRSRWCG